MRRKEIAQICAYASWFPGAGREGSLIDMPGRRLSMHRELAVRGCRDLGANFPQGQSVLGPELAARQSLCRQKAEGLPLKKPRACRWKNQFWLSIDPRWWYQIQKLDPGGGSQNQKSEIPRPERGSCGNIHGFWAR